MSLKGSKTEDNLKAAFAGESQANRRYLYFAAKADVEAQGLMPAFERNYLDKHDSVNRTAAALTKAGIATVAAWNLHK